MSEGSIFTAAAHMIRRGDVVRHLAIPGKEPLESPELLLRIARVFHSAPAASRPASFGVISASVPGILKWLPHFSDTPLCWLAVSVDVAGSGLRGGDPLRVLDAAIRGRVGGGTKAVAVNTTFRAETVDAVIDLGEQLRSRQLEQWALCPLIAPFGKTMQPAVEDSVVERVIERLGNAADVAKRVVVETDPPTLRRLMGESAWRALDTNVWRIEVLLPNGIWLFARSPMQGYFLRMRFDGSLISRQDFARIGVREGRYGSFCSPVDLDRALSEMAAERDSTKVLHPNSRFAKTAPELRFVAA